MSPLWIALWCLLYLQTTAAQQTEDCLVAVSNTTDGTSIILDCVADSSTGYDALLQGQYLSPLIRSPSALVTHNTTTTSRSSFAIFLPLSNSLGVVELTYNKAGEWAHDLTVIDIHCEVISVHKVRETYFTVCLNSNEELVMYQLYINVTNLNESYAQRSVPVATGNSFSNIVYATLQDDRILHRLFVVVGYHIRSVNPTEYQVTILTGGLPSDNCHTLEYAGDYVLLATCTDSGETYSVYYDINEKMVVNTTQGTDTIPFLCPPSEGRLTVNNTGGVVLFHNWSTNADTEFMLHGNIHFGVCFGDSKKTSLLFAYSNNEAGTYAINISHKEDNNVRLSSSACLQQNCRPVFTLDKYLVVQETKRDGMVVTQVRDPARNYSIMFEVNVVGITLINTQVENKDSQNGTNKTPHNETNTDSHNETYKIAVPSVVFVLCVIVTVVSAAILIKTRYKCKSPQDIRKGQGWYSLEGSNVRSKQEVTALPDGSGEKEHCPNDVQTSRSPCQRLNTTGACQTSLIHNDDENSKETSFTTSGATPNPIQNVSVRNNGEPPVRTKVSLENLSCENTPPPKLKPWATNHEEHDSLVISPVQAQEKGTGMSEPVYHGTPVTGSRPGKRGSNSVSPPPARPLPQSSPLHTPHQVVSQDDNRTQAFVGTPLLLPQQQSVHPQPQPHPPHPQPQPHPPQQPHPPVPDPTTGQPAKE